MTFQNKTKKKKISVVFLNNVSIVLPLPSPLFSFDLFPSFPFKRMKSHKVRETLHDQHLNSERKGTQEENLDPIFFCRLIYGVTLMYC